MKKPSLVNEMYIFGGYKRSEIRGSEECCTGLSNCFGRAFYGVVKRPTSMGEREN